MVPDSLEPKIIQIACDADTLYALWSDGAVSTLIYECDDNGYKPVWKELGAKRSPTQEEE